ncbi:penicillin-binding protein 1A [Breznakia blatticola]|uniref:Penicillin-binding protein 1A n=1 Tax=Breznakia blatticola TaxID=1754012 RepID=A0A4R8A279_9FIRM|nr:transglycosylase domain-containing protein [Breznakia blatticola]TDW24649.1 penicillin-binding protein 1A [Breznakia blatticola]
MANKKINTPKRSKPSNGQKTKTKSKLTGRRVVNTICIIILAGMMLVSVTGFVMLQDILSKKQNDRSELTANASTRMFAIDGSLITTLSMGDGIRENVKLEEIPNNVIDAFLAVEDSRYFEHNGFDLPRFIKSGVINVGAGGIRQGGSTLTMQLVDNANMLQLTEEEKNEANTLTKIEWKIQEIFNSMELEAEESKNDILENYLNKINFGGPARGIEKGAEYYFGKSVSDINLGEAAFLAGVINAPATNNPYNGVTSYAQVDENGEPILNEAGQQTAVVTVNHYDAAIERRNDTLYQMLNHGYISEQEYKVAVSEDLSFQLSGAAQFQVDEYQSFITYAANEVLEKTGYDPYTTPMDIYTTMDIESQQLADSICNSEAVDYTGTPFNINEQYDERYQTGFTLMNNQTGEILAFGGGRGDITKNRAWDLDQQPGSTAKPIIEYAAAFDNLGYSTEHVIEDGPTAYTDTDILWNADDQFRGDLDLREAINHSLNVPAFKTLQELVNTIGIDGVQDYMRKLGIPEDVVENFVMGYSIGGGDLRMTTLQLAEAYTTFANKGQRVTPYSVKEVKFQDTTIKTYKAKTEKTDVYSEGAAWLMSYMLAGAVDEGWGNINSFTNSGYRIYAKTGTSSYEDDDPTLKYPKGAGKDKWIVGYTDKYTVSVWAGYDKGVPGEDNYLDEYKLYNWNLEGRIARTMLDHITNNGEDASKEMFAQPADVSSISYTKGTWPYATTANNDTKAYILKKYAGNLKAIAADPLSDPSSITVTYKDGKVEYAMSAYPDASALEEKSHTKSMTAKGITKTGKLWFDKSFIFGVVQYKFTVKLNGTAIETFTGTSDKGVYEKLPSNAKNGDTVEVCGFYQYSKTDTKSKEVCASVTVDKKATPVGTEFLNLFQEGLTATEVKARVDTYMSANFPDVKNYVIVEDPTAKMGTMGKATTIKVGDILDASKSYIIAVGTKKAD